MDFGPSYKKGDLVVLQGGAVGQVKSLVPHRDYEGDSSWGYRSNEQILEISLGKKPGTAPYTVNVSDDGGMRCGELTKVGKKDYMVVYVDSSLESTQSIADWWKERGIQFKIGQNDEKGKYKDSYILAVSVADLGKIVDGKYAFNVSASMVQLLSGGREESKHERDKYPWKATNAEIDEYLPEIVKGVADIIHFSPEFDKSDAGMKGSGHPYVGIKGDHVVAGRIDSESLEFLFGVKFKGDQDARKKFNTKYRKKLIGDLDIPISFTSISPQAAEGARLICYHYWLTLYGKLLEKIGKKDELKEESKQEEQQKEKQDEKYWEGNAEDCIPWSEEKEGQEQDQKEQDQKEGDQKEQKDKPGKREIPRTDKPAEMVLIGREADALVFAERDENVWVQTLHGNQKRYTHKEWIEQKYPGLAFRNDFLVAPIGAWLPLENHNDYYFIPIEMSPKGIKAYWKAEVGFEFKKDDELGIKFVLVHSIQSEGKTFETGMMIVLPRFINSDGTPRDDQDMWNLLPVPKFMNYSLELFPVELNWQRRSTLREVNKNDLTIFAKRDSEYRNGQMLPIGTIDVKTGPPEILKLYDLSVFETSNENVSNIILWYPKENTTVVYKSDGEGNIISIDYYYGIEDLIKILEGGE